MVRPRKNIIRFDLQQTLGIKTNPAVFSISTLLILVFVVLGTCFTTAADQFFTAAQAFITHTFGWLYYASVTFFLYFCLWIGLGRYGKLRLGRDDERPSYSTFTWFSMLFTAGMGIGVLFWSVAEPITHFQSPPSGPGGTLEAARGAMEITLLHWGLHGWAIYVIVGLALAFFSYRRGLPLTLRSVFHPLLGERINGPIGHTVDIFAVLGTMFGVATTLGLGSQQINAGLNLLVNLPVSTGSQLVLIAVITLVATASVVSGLDKGIRRLSELTVWLALLLFTFILFAGPLRYTLGWIFHSLSGYVMLLGRQALWSSVGGSEKWQANWTLFYWGWWIAWSPFVGIFIARISRGRTIREFVLGVLLVPSAVTCLWFAVFGGTALHEALHGNSDIVAVVKDNYPIAIYHFFSGFPLSSVLSVLGALVIMVFFVTSSDSASLVIDYLTSGGNEDPPKRQRVFWATSEGVVAATLLLSGGLTPMRTFQIITGLPLCVTLLVACYSLVLGLRAERCKSVEA